MFDAKTENSYLFYFCVVLSLSIVARLRLKMEENIYTT